MQCNTVSCVAASEQKKYPGYWNDRQLITATCNLLLSFRRPHWMRALTPLLEFQTQWDKRVYSTTECQLSSRRSETKESSRPQNRNYLLFSNDIEINSHSGSTSTQNVTYFLRTFRNKWIIVKNIMDCWRTILENLFSMTHLRHSTTSYGTCFRTYWVHCPRTKVQNWLKLIEIPIDHLLYLSQTGHHRMWNNLAWKKWRVHRLMFT